MITDDTPTAKQSNEANATPAGCEGQECKGRREDPGNIDLYDSFVAGHTGQFPLERVIPKGFNDEQITSIRCLTLKPDGHFFPASVPVITEGSQKGETEPARNALLRYALDLFPKAGVRASGGHPAGLHVVVQVDATVNEVLQADRPRFMAVLQKLRLLLFCDKIGDGLLSSQSARAVGSINSKTGAVVREIQPPSGTYSFAELEEIASILDNTPEVTILRKFFGVVEGRCRCPWHDSTGKDLSVSNDGIFCFGKEHCAAGTKKDGSERKARKMFLYSRNPDQPTVAKLTLADDKYRARWSEQVSLYQEETKAEKEAKGATYTIKDLMGVSTEDDPNCLLGKRFLCRRGSMMIVGPTSVGKSTLEAQLAIGWALGIPMFGLKPKSCLRSLIVQAENDAGDLAEMVRGVITGMGLDNKVDKINENVKFVTESIRTNQTFVKFLEQLVEKEKPDLLWLDPLLAYLGGDASDQALVSKFLRNGLNPIAQKTGCAFIVVHHTPKPPRSKDGVYQGLAEAYLGIGSSDMSNWARGILTLTEADHEQGIFCLKGVKRGSRAGFTEDDDPDAPLADFRQGVHIRYGKDGLCWERSLPPEAPDRDLLEDAIRFMASQPFWNLKEIRSVVVPKIWPGIKDLNGSTAFRKMRAIRALCVETSNDSGLWMLKSTKQKKSPANEKITAQPKDKTQNSTECQVSPSVNDCQRQTELSTVTTAIPPKGDGSDGDSGVGKKSKEVVTVTKPACGVHNQVVNGNSDAITSGLIQTNPEAAKPLESPVQPATQTGAGPWGGVTL